MDIQNIGIIGGTHGIGQSFVEHFQEKYGETKQILASGRKTKITNKDIVAQCDLVIFAVPIAVTEKIILEHIAFSRSKQIWADFTSIKAKPVETMLQSKAEVCGMHPMFGPKKNIAGQKIIFTPARIKKENLLALEKLFEELEIIYSTPEEHDEIMSVVQGLSHFSDFVTGATIKNLGIDFKRVLEFSSPPYQLKLDVLGRMFAQNPELYAQIATQNPQTIKTTQAFFNTFEKLKNYVDVGAHKELTKEFCSIRDFLGKSFCDNAYARSERILNKQVVESGRNLTSTKYEHCDLAIFGEKNSHTDEASELFLERKKASSINYYKNIFEVFEAVENGTAKAGVVPYENSTNGSVFATLDELFEREKVCIVAAEENDIHQHLVGIPGTKIGDIRRIISHPQALAQSQKWIRNHLQNIEILSEPSTAVAASKVKYLNDPHIAAIASEKNAHHLGLEILQRSIQEQENRTRFVLIKNVGKRHTCSLRQETKYTSFVFWFASDKSGNLEEVLRTFSDEGINLTKIDSRRASKEYGRYLFFVDAEISVEKAKNILPTLKKNVGGVRILGGF